MSGNLGLGKCPGVAALSQSVSSVVPSLTTLPVKEFARSD